MAGNVLGALPADAEEPHGQENSRETADDTEQRVANRDCDIAATNQTYTLNSEGGERREAAE